MNTNVAETKPKPIKYQVYLGDELQQAFERYSKEKYGAGTSVKTAVFKKALIEFLKKEGYYDIGEVSSGTKD